MTLRTAAFKLIIKEHLFLEIRFVDDLDSKDFDTQDFGTEDLDEMIVDILVAGHDRHEQIIANALEAESEGTGLVRVAARADLIWLKRQRNSKQDQADIARLSDEEA